MRITFAILLLSLSVNAQFYNGTQMDFGKNRVQYNDVFWSYYKYKKFNIYFYNDGKELADYTAISANNILTELEDFFDHEVSTKFEIVVYNSCAQALQSNIGNIGEEKQNNASITRLLGNKLCVYFDGSHENYNKVLRSGIASVMINKVLYGEDIGEILKNSSTTTIPDWYYYGLISFLAESWNSSINNDLKDAFALNAFENFNEISGENAKLAGHSIWKYIADTYGGENALRLIYMTKMSHDVNDATLFILGLSAENLIKEWKAHQENLFSKQNVESLSAAEEKFILPIKTSSKKLARELKISPNNEWLTYNINKEGKNKIILYNIATKKKKVIFKKGYAIDLPLDKNYPLITWHPNGEFISIFFEDKGEIQWWLYEIKTDQYVKNTLQYFNQLLDAEYSPDGKKIVFSVVHKGMTDIYVYDVAARMQEAITNDFYDDLYPQFINGGKQIVFVSNRTSDTMNLEGKTNDLYSSNLDVFVFDYSAKKSMRYEEQVLKRITNTPSVNEKFPVEWDKEKISFLSDENGIYNRYFANTKNDSLYALNSQYTRNINYLHSNKDNALQITRFNGKDQLMLIAKKEIKEVNSIKAATENNAISFQNIELGDKTEYSEIERYKSRNEYIDKFKKDEDFVDISDYQFKKKELDKTSEKENTETKVKTAASKKALERNYEAAFSVEEASIDIGNNFINPTYQTYTGGPINTGGLSPIMLFGTKDLLENYYVRGGLRISGMRNNEVFISFEKYKKQLDHQYVLYRRSSSYEAAKFLFKNVSYEATYKITYPFSIVDRIRFSGTLRYDDLITLTRENVSLNIPSISTYRAVLRSEYVFDATKDKAVNIKNGTRFKIFGEYFQNVKKLNKNTAILGVDYRTYLPIYKDFIFAGRIAASTSFGSERLMYYLGGVDGWLSPKFNSDLAPSTLSGNNTYAFQTLASHMRGFIQNVRNGSNFAVINSELRFPFVKMLYHHTLSSGWLQHMQFMGFFDLGTAWSGWNPLSEENSLNNKTIYLGGEAHTGFINIKTQRDPVVGGLGFGLRTLLWGYHIRADWAWGIEDGAFKKNRVFYLSLNYDF